MRNQLLRAIFGFGWGLLLFLGVARSLRLALGSIVSDSPVVSQVVLKTALVLIALVGWKLIGEPFGEMGWRRADWWNRSYLVWFAIAAASMIAGSVAVIMLETRHPIASQMRFLQLVAVIWLLSSLSEEVYVRGLVQSWIADRGDLARNSSVVKPSIVSSALLFAAMHVPLMWSPMGVKGGLALVVSTLGLGWACAVLRDRSGSLWPAIACHVAGNVAGIPGGIIGVVLYRLVFGHMPEFLNSG
jgi:membrane protease YdiL (CAAX protease family)